jgi:hypothetical protein
MLLETRIWKALNIFAILISAFGTLYAGLYVPNVFTEKQLQSTFPVTAAVAGTLFPLEDKDRIQLSLMIGNEPVKNNLVVSTIGIINTGSVAIIPSDYYTNLSINVDKQWKILAVINATWAERPVWKKVTDQQFEASPELLNPGDTITVFLYVTNTEHERLAQQQLIQLKPTWSAHILNLKSITEVTNPFVEIVRDPLIKFPFVVVLYGSGLMVTLFGTIFLMIIYINLLYDLSYLKGSRWQSVGAMIGVGILSLTSSEAMTTYLFPNIWVRLTGGISNWLNMPWIVLNLVMLVWLSWKAWNARARSLLPHT